jgi:site-specific DNA recombinase
MTPREEEAQVLREAANQIAQGISLRAVVADLNKRKMPTTNGAKPWVSLTLKDALISPRNAGYASYHGEIVGDAEWPAIIARDVWHAVEQKLTDPNRRTNGHVGGAVKWLGSGIYRCGVCESTDVRVHTHSGSGKKRYRCRNRIKGEPVNHVGRDAVMLDAYVDAALIARLSEPKVLKRLTPKGPGVDVSGLRKEIASARKALRDIAAGLGNSQITMAMAAESTAIATARIQKAEARLAASGDGNPLAVFSSSSDIAATWYGPGGPNGDRVGGLSLGTRREILRLMADVTILPAPFGPAVDGRGFKEECVRIDFKS